VHVDAVAQIVETSKLAMQAGGVIVVGDCCISFEAKSAEIRLVTVDRGSLPTAIMDFADPFVS
jgi:hypothetical protein